jgi:hypothetical protein
VRVSSRRPDGGIAIVITATGITTAIIGTPTGTGVIATCVVTGGTITIIITAVTRTGIIVVTTISVGEGLGRWPVSRPAALSFDPPMGRSSAFAFLSPPP